MNELIEAVRGLGDAGAVVHDLLVDVVHVAELAEVDGLLGADELDLGGVGGGVVEGDDHAAGHVEELPFDLEDAGRHAHVFWMGRGAWC